MVEEGINSQQFGSFYYPMADLLMPSEDKNYDKYGFKLPYPLIDIKELDKFLVQYTEKVLFREKQWNAMLHEHNHLPPERNNKVKRYIRKGIPSMLRAKMWFYYSSAENIWLKNQGLYKHLITKIMNHQDIINFAREIDQDLHRTFPNNKHFKTKPNGNFSIGFDPNSNAILSALRRVLLCFQYYRTEIGYQQSFSYIVGLLLLFMDEEKTFFMLLNIVDNIMLKEVYKKGDKGSTIMVRSFLSLLRNSCPKIWQHFLKMEKKGMPSIGLAISHWFPLLFCDLLPIESNLRVWDTLFYEGDKVLYRVGLALFKLFENELMMDKEPMELFQFIQNLPKLGFNCMLLMDLAFSKECTFKSADLKKYRQMVDQMQ